MLSYFKFFPIFCHIKFSYENVYAYNSQPDVGFDQVAGQ